MIYLLVMSLFIIACVIIVAVIYNLDNPGVRSVLLFIGIITAIILIPIISLKINAKNKVEKHFKEIDFYNKYSQYLRAMFLTNEISVKLRASSQVVSNFSYKPLPYLVKYFNFQVTSDAFYAFELYRELFANLYKFANNRSFYKSYINKFLIKRELYYISPKGQSKSNHVFIFDLTNSNKLYYELYNAYHKKTPKVQRAKLTSSLRELVLRRDNFTCQKCGNSIFNEPNLLLEVDHIIPISRGGKTELENLQTLCWKCNRSKGSNI